MRGTSIRAGSPTCGIQDAVDALPKEGGQVILDARTYIMRAPIVMRDDVRLTGQGTTTIMTRGKEVIHKVTADVGPKGNTVTVDATDGLRLGDEIGVRDDERGGWYMTHGRVLKIEGNVITLDTELARDYAVKRNAIIINHFPIVEAYRRVMWDDSPYIRRIVIEDITVEGNLAENPTPISDWTTSAIHLTMVADSIVQRCVVRNWITDGISDQRGIDNLIQENLVENCRTNGYHPGTCVRGSRFINNVSRNNGGDGLFFCAVVTGCYITGNTFIGNKKNGIGHLGGADDRYNVVSNNVITDNRLNGIQVYDGAYNVVTNNICQHNSLAEPGKYAGILVEDSTDTLVTNNICGGKLAEGEKGTQGYGILEIGKSDRNMIKGNIVVGNAETGVKTIGKATVNSENVN